MLRIGTAGWTIPTLHAEFAPGPGTHLERYARVLPCVEINSSFYRSHRLSTWQRWAASTPQDFRFSVKLPKSITHLAKLAVPPAALDPFFAETAALGSKLGVILVQLPPSLAYEDCPAAEFFEALRERTQACIALEPRHPTWFTPAAEALMLHHRIARVAADPPRLPASNPQDILRPAAYPGLAYYRLHGSPRTYYSNYDEAWLTNLTQTIGHLPAATETWVIFDNTALGHAFANAVALQSLAANRKGAAEAAP